MRGMSGGPLGSLGGSSLEMRVDVSRREKNAYRDKYDIRTYVP